MSPGAGAVSTGFCVSVGWPVTSPGREDMPGSVAVPWSPLVLGAAGREMLPELPWSVVALPLVEPEPDVLGLEPTEPLVPEPVVAEPELEVSGGVAVEPPVLEPELDPIEPVALEPVSVPEVVPELESDEVRVRCIELVSLELRPWPCFLWCFLCFLAEVLLVASLLLPDEVEPLIASSLSWSLSLTELLDELSFPMPVLVELEPTDGLALEESAPLVELVECGSEVFEVEVSVLGVELLDGLLLGRLELLLAVLDELPGSALLF